MNGKKIKDSRISSQPVDNVSGVILVANPSRGDCDLTNVGTEMAYLARGEAAVLLSGIPLTGITYSAWGISLNLREIRMMTSYETRWD